MKTKIYHLSVIIAVLFMLTAPVFALENYANGPLLEKLRSYNPVAKAFERRVKREAKINKLIKDGMCGEAKMGFLVTRFANIPEPDRALLEAENRDRQVVMIGIAKALLEVAEKPVTEDTVRAKLPVAIKFFCDLREKTVPKGTWIQNADGEWKQKY